MLVAIIADTHWGVRGDSPTFHQYFSRFYREIFFPYLVKHNIKTVIHLGDLVDRRKFLTYSTANVMRKEYIEPSEQLGLRTHVIAGNHDCYHKNSNEVNALREIVMGRDGFIIYSNPVDLNLEREHRSVKVLMLPWISPDNELKSAQAIMATSAEICFAHLELKGFEMARGQMMDHGMDASVFSKFKAVYTGHYHMKSSKGNIHYLGSPYEMTWADCDDPKGFHVLDTDTMKIEYIQNPITLFQKIHFDANTRAPDTTDKIVKVIVHPGANRKTLDKFVSNMEKSALDIQVLDDHLNVDDSGGQAIMIDDLEDTMKIVNDYVMASEIDADKAALIGLLKQLYMEAQHQ